MSAMHIIVYGFKDLTVCGEYKKYFLKTKMNQNENQQKRQDIFTLPLTWLY